MRRHGELLAEHFRGGQGMRDIRKHVAWYLHGFPVGGDSRRALALVKTVEELDELLSQLDQDAPFPEVGDGPRGRQGSPGSVSLPAGWLDDPDDDTVPEAADDALRRLSRDRPETAPSQHCAGPRSGCLSTMVAVPGLRWRGRAWACYKKCTASEHRIRAATTPVRNGAHAPRVRRSVGHE